MRPTNLEFPATTLLVIDGSANDRAFYTERLRRCASDYLVLEAADGPSGLDLYRSQRIDCVVLDLELPNQQSGLEILINLVPIASRPHVAVIMLTRNGHRGVWELAHRNGACACFVKQLMAVEDLDRAIQRAIAFVGQLPKEDRYRPI